MARRLTRATPAFVFALLLALAASAAPFTPGNILVTEGNDLFEYTMAGHYPVLTPENGATTPRAARERR